RKGVERLKQMPSRTRSTDRSGQRQVRGEPRAVDPGARMAREGPKGLRPRGETRVLALDHRGPQHTRGPRVREGSSTGQAQHHWSGPRGPVAPGLDQLLLPPLLELREEGQREVQVLGPRPPPPPLRGQRVAPRLEEGQELVDHFLRRRSEEHTSELQSRENLV